MLIYLDNCCFNKPYDDQKHPLVKLETESKLLIQFEIMYGKLKLVWSYMSTHENNDNPSEDRKKQIATWKALASTIIMRTPEIDVRVNSLLALGIKVKDTLQIACAIAADADYFITTDKKVLKKT